MSGKPWRAKELKFEDKAIIVIDDNKSQASVHAGKIIDHFSCQAASAADYNEFAKLLARARAEKCEIAGIICDESLPNMRGSELFEDIRSGRLNYLVKNFDQVPFMLVTGDVDLLHAVDAYGGKMRDARVLCRKAWKNFDDHPETSAIGQFIAKALNVEIAPHKPNGREHINGTTLRHADRLIEDDKTKEYSTGYQSRDEAYMRELQRADRELLKKQASRGNEIRWER